MFELVAKGYGKKILELLRRFFAEIGKGWAALLGSEVEDSLRKVRNTFGVLKRPSKAGIGQALVNPCTTFS